MAREDFRANQNKWENDNALRGQLPIWYARGTVYRYVSGVHAKLSHVGQIIYR